MSVDKNIMDAAHQAAILRKKGHIDDALSSSRLT